ncbi:hypothetical protein BVX97_03230 [bacterium E08(2017)]|nr:hypothetical protein BVX97_03230 [bacterium E08(2017)]
MIQTTTSLTLNDRIGSLLVRLCIGRGDFRVKPGLYTVGDPGKESDVFVTANYKMSFDYLRSSLHGRNAYILVLDTDGINVWCAAGKGTFGTDELVSRILSTQLQDTVSHKRIIVPQLGASGVCGREVTKQTGFKVIFGPVRTADLSAFLDSDMTATPEMRRVRFDLKDRAVLIPVDLVLAGKYMLPLILMLIIGSIMIPSISSEARRGATALFAGWFAGGVLAPLALPILPGRAFSTKGAFAGLVASGILSLIIYNSASLMEIISWMLLITSSASFISMNFTGTSTYTSPSGVKKEMRFSVPSQAAGFLIGLILMAITMVRCYQGTTS